MNTKAIVSVAVAAIFGVIHYLSIAWAWRYIPDNPLTQWLFHILPGTGLFYPIIYIHDVLISIVIGIPLATIVFYLRPVRYWLYLSVAIVPSVVWFNFIAVENFTFFRGWYALAVILMELLSVPIALLLIVKFRGEKSHLRRRQAAN